MGKIGTLRYTSQKALSSLSSSPVHHALNVDVCCMVRSVSRQDLEGCSINTSSARTKQRGGECSASGSAQWSPLQCSFICNCISYRYLLSAALCARTHYISYYTSMRNAGRRVGPIETQRGQAARHCDYADSSVCFQRDGLLPSSLA